MLVSSVDSYNMLQEMACATIDFHAKNHSSKTFYQRWSTDLVKTILFEYTFNVYKFPVPF